MDLTDHPYEAFVNHFRAKADASHDVLDAAVALFADARIVPGDGHAGWLHPMRAEVKKLRFLFHAAYELAEGMHLNALQVVRRSIRERVAFLAWCAYDLLDHPEVVAGVFERKKQQVYEAVGKKVRKHLWPSDSGLTAQEAESLAFMYHDTGTTARDSRIEFAYQVRRVFDGLRLHSRSTPPLYYWLIDYWEESSVVHCDGTDGCNFNEECIEASQCAEDGAARSRILTSQLLCRGVELQELVWVWAAALADMVIGTPFWTESTRTAFVVAFGRLEEWSGDLEVHWKVRVQQPSVDEALEGVKAINRALFPDDPDMVRTLDRSWEEHAARAKQRPPRKEQE